jgi:RNA polymerase sigma-70 factor (ECF subfamily)
MTEERTRDELLRRLGAGQEEAFAELYDRFGRRLFRAAHGMLGSHEDAEDVVQEVFVSLYRSRLSLTAVRDLETYLFACLRHAAGRHANRSGKRRRAASAASQANSVAADGAEPNNMSGDLKAALASLPPAQRQVIALKIDAGLTFAQIGDVLNISPNTAASRYRYALEKLRAAFREE